MEQLNSFVIFLLVSGILLAWWLKGAYPALYRSLTWFLIVLGAGFLVTLLFLSIFDFFEPNVEVETQ